MLSLLRDETYNSYLELFSFVSSTPVQPYYCTMNYGTFNTLYPCFRIILCIPYYIVSIF